MSIPASKVADLSQEFSGPLLQAGDTHYDEVRQVHNGFVDKRPALIARCRGVADIVAAVKFARAADIPVAVRGGGHNVSGRATIEGGLMIDLSLLKGISVSPGTRRVRAQGGVTWGEFNRETQVHGLATTGGVVSTTGIGGLTLGGGLGWLLGSQGLAIDNLRAVELVTADGDVLMVSAEQHPDLFWALRGGGGNFGIAASLEYNLQPVGPTIHGGAVFHPFSAGEDMLRFYRDMTESAPDDLTLFAGFLHAPDGSGNKLGAIVAAYCGPADGADQVLKPLKSFGPPAMDMLGPISYCQVNTLFDAALPRGARNYWKSSFVSGLTDDAIRALVDTYTSVTSPMSQLLLEHFHGALTRVAPDATAFPHRQAGYNLVMISQWTAPAEDQRHVAWTRERYAALQPYARGARYSNYLDHDDTADAAVAAYGGNYTRLQQIKAKYDPDNFFRQNLNVKPAEPSRPGAAAERPAAAGEAGRLAP
jgi:FAD/FMN-containing dehydrogenase